MRAGILWVLSQAAPADSDFEKMGPPKPGEWLSVVEEAHQSFADFRRSAPEPKDGGVIYVQPMGKANDLWSVVLDKMREYASVFFARPAKFLDPLPMPAAAYAAEREQHDAGKIIDGLAGRRPADAVMLLAITDADLYSGRLNFVFGSGSLVSRCGVYSLRRLDVLDDELFLRRAIKLMTHEAGHLLGITHCVRYRCLMNGSNHLAESDSRPIFLCPDDLEKAQWAMKFEVVPRYEKMLEFLRRNKLARDARWLESRLVRLRGR